MPPQNQTAPVSLQPMKIGKFAASKQIVKESWNVLMQDKEIIWFPVLSGIFTFVVLGILFVLYLPIFLGGDMQSVKESETSLISYVLLFLNLVVVYCIANFFNSALYIVVYARFNGGNLTFKDGINGASKNFGKIFAWSVLVALVGVILQVIRDKGKIFGKIFAALGEASWNILTYFSLISIVIGGKSIKDSFGDSASTIKKTWGETLIVNFGAGLFFMILILGGICLIGILAFMIPDVIVWIALGIILVVYVVVLSLISTTLGSIFKLALYEYAKTGQVPNGFSPDLVKNAFKK